MSVEAKLTAKKRTGAGSAYCRRLRREGRVPGNLYGHTEAPVSVETSHDAVLAIVHDGHLAVDIDVDGHTDKAIFREVQWDTYGKQILHFDLLRVDPQERVQVEVPIEVRGTAPGALNEGGILDLHTHSLTVDCLAYKIPSNISIRVNNLHLGDAIRVEDISLEEGVDIVNPGDTVIVQVVEPRRPAAEAEEPAEGEAEGEGEGEGEPGDAEEAKE